MNGEMVRRTVLTLVCGLALWLAVGANASAQAYLPSMKIGTAPLVSPTDANNFYGSSTSASHRAGYIASPPEIVALARALKNDPDLIYHYVRDNIDEVWEYGLQKGALGASIDKAATPFDQALLMVALLRQAGYSANLEAGTIVLSGAQFAAWTNIQDANAACQMLSGGGIPAQINGSTVGNCAYGTGTAISSVRMAHIWVKVTISGSTCGNNCLFDPSYKSYHWLAGIDLAGATGFTPGAAIAAATTGMESGTQFSPSLPYVRNLGAGGLNSLLQGYAASLLTYLKTNNLGGDEMEDIVSGGVIIPAPSSSLRQTSLPYADPTPPYAVHDWTDIPDQYRTTLEVSATMNSVALFDVPFFADEIYGRRLTIGTNFNANDMHFPGDFATFIVSLKLDDQVLTTQSIGVVPNGHYPAPVTIVANHPYAAAQTGGLPGTYMDVTLTKNVILVTPVSIVVGWGDTSPELLSKWSGERAEDLAGPARLNTTCSGECPMPLYMSPIGDFTREKVQAGYLGQFTRAAHLHAALAGGLVQIHHVLGVVYSDDYVDDDGNSRPPGSPPNYFVTDSFTRLDIDSGLSFASKTADALARRAAIQAIAATGAALEGAVMAQTADVPDTASTAARFEWGNSPTCVDHTSPYWNCEDPSLGGPRKFFQLGPSVSVPSGFAVWENGTPPPPDFGNDPLGAPQNWAPDEMNALTGFIGAYTAAGFTVTASQESFLGPGQRGGFIKVNGSPPAVSYNAAWTKQRGGAFVATRYDPATGDPLEIAHDVVGLIAPDASGHLVPAKGGGGGTPPSAGPTYNPATAADILKSRSVDRSNALGINLSNGSMSYDSPAAISNGNGGFPYELSASHAFHQGSVPTTDFGPIFPGSPAGWTSNWYNALTISGSGMEGMGASDVRAAAGAIVAFLAAQDIYKSSPSAQRDVAAVLTQSWLMHQFSGNSVSVVLSGGTRQFLRLADGSWVAPGSAYATLTLSGTRVPFTYMCPAWSSTRGEDYALSRGWDSSGLAFTVTNAQGDQQHYSYWLTHYQTADLGVGSECGRASGFRFDSWSFPQGVSVTAHYTSGTASDGSNHSSSPNADTSYPSSTTLHYVDNTIGRRLTFVAGTPNITDGTRTLQGPQLFGDGTFGVVDPAGDVTDFTMGAAQATTPTQRPVPFGQLVQVRTPFNLALGPDPHTLDLQYDYDALGEVAAVHDAVALQTATRAPYAFYIADGTRGERDDPLGGAYSVVYDTYKHPSRYVDELGRETDAAFDSRGRVTSYTYPELDSEFFAYDEHNNAIGYTRVAKPGSGLANLNVSATYDQIWNKPLTITNARGVTTTLTYYASGTGASLMATAVRPADGFDNGPATYSFTYTSIGKPLTAVDPDGVITTNGYDGSGNLTSTALDPAHLNIVTGFGYDTIGNVISATDPRGYATTSSFDANRRKLEDDRHNGSSGAALLAATQSIYDAHGWVTDTKAVKVISPATWIVTAHNSYTPTGKLASITDADNRTIVTTYDALDRVATVTDPVGKAVHNDYDAAGELTVESRGWGTPLQQAYATHTYTPNGKEASVFDALGGAHLTSYSYDGFDRLSRTTFADASHEDLTYDENANVVSRVTRSGAILNYVYDLLDRLHEKDISALSSNAHELTWTYTPAGRTTFIDDTAGQAILTALDTAGRPISDTASVGDAGGSLTVAWTLDKSGNRTQLKWPDAYAVDYAFDGLNRLSAVTEDSTSTPLAAYSYDPLSRRTSLIYNGGTSAMTYGYTDAGDLTSLSDDLAGTTNDVTFSNTFTPAHQLQTASTSNPAYVWTPAAASDAYQPVNNLNQYQSINGAFLTWDGNGNLLSQNNGAWTYNHDPENRMLRATATDGSMTMTMENDPQGRRSAKTVRTPDLAIIRFLHEGPSEIGEYTQFGGLIRRFIPGAAIDDYVEMEMPGSDDGLPGTKTYFHTDRQGSVIAMADSTGALAEGPYTYDAYGNCFVGASTTSCMTLPTTTVPFRYTGQRFDAETGLYYYRARYYSPMLGRFAETDPVGYGPDINWYSYVGNDPTDKYDPMGLQAIPIAPPYPPPPIPGQPSQPTTAQIIRHIIDKIQDAVAHSNDPAPMPPPPEPTLVQPADPLVPPIIVVANDSKPGNDAAGGTGSAKPGNKEHTSGIRPSTKEKHEKGQGRLKKDGRGEKGDARRPYKR